MKSIFYLSLVLLVISLIYGCNNKEISDVKVPDVITSDVIFITKTTATVRSKVTSDEGAPITTRGVCWKRGYESAINLTIADSHTNDGNGEGTFVSYLTGLQSCVNFYWVRAYAVNSAGISYGNEIPFTTFCK